MIKKLIFGIVVECAENPSRRRPWRKKEVQLVGAELLHCSFDERNHRLLVVFHLVVKLG